ncbi:tetratricopeptide repeat protein [Maribacter confluentis]|uniref:SH3 domain-containing protein n=2 Tax=Maribacter TaxID=252356 RepID=A0ABY1SJF3_9FLAO|nr:MULTISPECIES: tetratricopeptide repeat protein [Maribacter]MDO1512703.1 tetratricopeptide repeat protein [Maribacter confluentis]TVZ15936.1 SH3 domain-containing protein [Maribacter sp. MAR_2009_72]SNR57924.1 SH3 domain-containing protein [Maribacter sedimenticola]
MFKKIAFIIGLFTVICCSAQNNKLFDQATTAYNAGEYDSAIEYYTQILDNGKHSAAVYFNMGNAYYKLNKIAESIYYYEKALLLAPNDQEIKTNLSYAQNMTLDAIDTLPETGLSKLYKNITGKLTFDQWAYLAIAAMLAFVILYILFYFSNYSTRKRWTFIGSLLALFVSLVAIVFAYIQQSDFNAWQPAIIFAEESVIKSEPNTAGQQLFILHSGTKVNVLDELEQWNKIQLTDGKTGWANKEDLRLLKDF